MAKRKTKPIVAVVGRPNVGKSTLFNALAGENISIVKDTPGITRDRIYADIHWLDMTFTLIDTGGIEPVPDAGTGRDRYGDCRRDHFPGGCKAGTGGCGFQGGRHAAPFPQARGTGGQ